MLKVSVIIPTYKRCNSVRRLLTALNNQTYSNNDFEVIVSIDGSEDGTKEIVREFSAAYKLSFIWEPNSGRATACNRGIHKAEGELLIILDDDMEPSPGFIQAHCNAHTMGQKFGVIGGAPIQLDESSTPVIRYIADKFNSRYNRMSEPGYQFKIWDFYSGNFSIKRSDILKAGAYTESFKDYGHEDIELAYRLIKSGVKIVYDPDAMCTQYNNDDLKNLAKKSLSSGKNVVLFTTIYPDTFDQFELSRYYNNGWKWRFLRRILIWFSTIFPPTIKGVVFIVDRLNISNQALQNKLFSLVLDYLFWLGVWSAASANNNSQIISKILSYNRN